MGRIIEIKCYILDGKPGRLTLDSGVPMTFKTKKKAQDHADLFGRKALYSPRRVKVAVTWQGR